MATTNLNSQSLGDVLVESGNGTPNHSSPVGSFYTNIDTGSIFINNNGSTNGWSPMNRVVWGEIYCQDNTTNTAGTTSWATLSGLTWNFYGGNGVTASNMGSYFGNGKLIVQKSGTYNVLATGSVQVQNSTAAYTFYLGVSKNGVDPVNGFWGSAMCDGNLTATALEEDDKCISISGVMSLNAGDTLELKMRMSSAVTDGRLESGNITIYRVND